MEADLKKGKCPYEVEVSDVSDVELVDTVHSVENALEVERKNSFEIFQPNRRRRACKSREVETKEEKLHLNPPRSDQEMVELGKRRWVCEYNYFKSLNVFLSGKKRVKVKVESFESLTGRCLHFD